MAISSCLNVVTAALPHSSLSPTDRLLWLIDRSLEDEYSLLDTGEKVFGQRAYIRTHWQEVSSTLETRLLALTKPRSKRFAHRYRRGRLLHTLLDAYARTGWKERISPRLEDEVIHASAIRGWSMNCWRPVSVNVPDSGVFKATHVPPPMRPELHRRCRNDCGSWHSKSGDMTS